MVYWAAKRKERGGFNRLGLQRDKREADIQSFGAAKRQESGGFKRLGLQRDKRDADSVWGCKEIRERRIQTFGDCKEKNRR